MSEKKPEPSQFAEATKLIDAFKSSLNSYEKFLGAFTKTVHDNVTKPVTVDPKFQLGQIVWYSKLSEFVTVINRLFDNGWRYAVTQSNGNHNHAKECELSETEPYEIQVGDPVLMDTPKRGCWFRDEKAEVVRTHVPGLLGVRILRTNKTYWVRDYAVIAEVDVKPASKTRVDHFATSKKQTTTASQASKSFEKGQEYFFTSDNAPFWKKGDSCVFVEMLGPGQIEVAKDGSIFRVATGRVSTTNPNTPKASTPEVFNVGDWVYIKEDCPGFRSGSRCKVVTVWAGSSGKLEILDEQGFKVVISPDKVTKVPPKPETFELGELVYLLRPYKGLPRGAQVRLLYQSGCEYGVWNGSKEFSVPGALLSKTVPRSTTYDNQWMPPDDFNPMGGDAGTSMDGATGACYGYGSAKADFESMNAKIMRDAAAAMSMAFDPEIMKRTSQAMYNMSQPSSLPKIKTPRMATPFPETKMPKIPTEANWPNEASQFKIHDLVNLINATGFPCDRDTSLKIKSIDRDNRRVVLTLNGNSFETGINNIRRVR